MESGFDGRAEPKRFCGLRGCGRGPNVRVQEYTLSRRVSIATSALNTSQAASSKLVVMIRFKVVVFRGRT